MLQSMTGFAARQGSHGPHSWSWELRSVNGRGLDLRLRVPDWIPGLETALRAQLTKALGRGNVTLSLRITREEGEGGTRLDTVRLGALLDALEQVEQAAIDKGISLAPSRAADLLMQRGVLDGSGQEDDNAALGKALLADFDPLLAAFIEMRTAEGSALEQILKGQIDRIAALTEEAAAEVETRRSESTAAFHAALGRVMEGATGADPDRVAQELALLAVKADVTEELDRLRAHVGAARDLIGQGEMIGRKLDFLTQEFNREANTLCSKSQNAGLTRIGLELKAVIDQMREQVQNVE
ncbi:YicC/YloC family endoribonuclease [Maritimibacter alkaliphilus]|uniref:YicC/YloC family endoribonuclease n=1 Tax=Maritimibacter alkaliphilus TaxID=404236 RepID=UPI001C93DA85|nr:YicC/YloC family endoribonuclease [Maritimibacter alkaliphilus]MBY6089721.1 YicC family protein [Maritimibacter alkaliphilus]